MMLDDVATVETAGRPAARSPDTKAAIAYLAASAASTLLNAASLINRIARQG
jgi:hypothetical protein